jgi:nucleoside-diphosphate-sugar epimerase
MHIAIAGAHGQVARRLSRLLSARGDTVTGIVRNPAHTADLTADGAAPVALDLETAGVDEVAAVLAGVDAVVFAAGAGPGSGVARKDTVDRAAAVLLADGAEEAGVDRYLLVSSMGVESVRDGAVPDGVDEVFLAYLRAKLAAEQDLLGRAGLRTTVLRPGSLTDDPGTGRVTLAGHVQRGSIPRDDVAAVLMALLDAGRDGAVLELVSGPTPVAEAVAATGCSVPARLFPAGSGDLRAGGELLVDRVVHTDQGQPPGRGHRDLAGPLRARQQGGRPLRRTASLPHRGQGADEAAHHRVAEGIGRRAHGDERAGAPDVQSQQGADGRGTLPAPAERGEVVLAEQEAGGRSHGVDVQRAGPAHGVGTAQRRWPRGVVGEPVDVVPAQGAEAGIEVGVGHCHVGHGDIG